MSDFIQRAAACSGPARICLVLLGVAAFAGMLGAARAFGSFPGDEWAVDGLRQLRTEWLVDFAAFMSALGRAGTSWGGLGVPWIPCCSVAYLLLTRRWYDALFLLAASLAPVVNFGLKELAARSRPDLSMALVEEAGYAFPSGHSVFAASFCGALIILMGRPDALAERPVILWTFRGVLFSVVLAVGFSRVYLGVHWPSDVLGGFLFAAIYLALLLAVRSKAIARLKCIGDSRSPVA